MDYVGNNTTATYSYTFKIFSKNDLRVTKKNTSNVETLLVVDTDYTVTGVGSLSGGTIVLTAGNLATGHTLTIRRVRSLVQETDIRNQGDFFPESIENSFDHLVMLAQQHQDEINRSLKLPESVSSSGFSAALPADIVDGAGRGIAVNDDGDGFTLGPTSTQVAQYQAAANSSPPWFNVLDFGDGVKTGATISAAMAALEAGSSLGSGAKYALLIKRGDWTISTNLTIPSNVQFIFEQGAVLNIATGVTVAYSGPGIQAPFSKIFSLSGTGVFSFLGEIDCVYPQWWGAVGDSISNDYVPIQSSMNCGAKHVQFIPKTYKILSTVNLPASIKISGNSGSSTIIAAHGCSVFNIQAGSNGVTIDGLYLESYSAGGAPDPKTTDGIISNGISGSTCANHRFRNLFLRGFSSCLKLSYTWNTTIESLITFNCTYGVELFGQSVNNSIVNSIISAITGTASIYLNADGATIGEGLMVSNTLLSEGQYGITSDNGFLSLNISNCIIDLITDTCVNAVDIRGLLISGSWLYSANNGVLLNDVGVPVNSNVSITGNNIITTGINGICVKVGYNNLGVSLSSTTLTTSGNNSYCLYSNSENTVINSGYMKNGGVNSSIFFSQANCLAIGISGDNSITYNSGISKLYARYIQKRIGINYSPSITIDASTGNFFTVAPNNGSSFTINAPTNPPTDPESQTITIEIRNSTGGALGAITWDPVFKMGSWTSPATGNRRCITFAWDASVWVETCRTATDIPN